MRDAIFYIRQHAQDRPSISLIAKHVGMSPSRFEHAFRRWAGTTPGRYLSYITNERAKAELSNSKNMLAAAYRSGLSGSGRLHDLLVTYEALSPGEFKKGTFVITYGIHKSPFGWCTIGVTPRGIIHLAFLKSDRTKEAVTSIHSKWPKAILVRDDKATKKYIDIIFKHKNPKRPLHLLLRGTNFQIKVWQALLALPSGTTASYGAIAKKVGAGKASRAVGSACGKNSIGFLIPCHRVLTSEGGIGGYRWGTDRKEAILAWEKIKTQV